MSGPCEPPPMPAWAIELAGLLLRSGANVQQIEQRLVARGLSQAAAAGVVERALEDRIRQQVEPEQRAARHLFMHRVLSGIVGGACLLSAFALSDTWTAIQFAGGILTCLAWIWFGDDLGGYIRAGFRTDFPEGVIVRMGGWLILLLVVFFLLRYGIFIPVPG